MGVGINFGSGSNGISVNASVNKGKGSETGSGTTHTETTLDAGNHLNIVSGRDTTLTGAQASDNYDSKQQNYLQGHHERCTTLTGKRYVISSDKDSHSLQGGYLLPPNKKL